MPYPDHAFRRTNFKRAEDSGAETPNTTMLDAEFNGLTAVLEQHDAFIRAIATADKRLQNVAVATAQSLAGSQRMVATALQTAFTTTIVWQAAFTSANVHVFIAGVKIDSSLVTVANSGGFLRVTLAAQPLNTVVEIAAYESGAGLTTTLAAAGGAALVGITDATSVLTAVTVEAALTEIMTALNTYIALVGNVGTILRSTGVVALAANLAAANNTITGLRASVANGEAVRHEQLQAVITQLNTATSAFLPKSGGTMSGVLNMGSQKITDLANGTAATDAATVAQVSAAIAAQGAFPVGVVVAYSGAAAPSGWLLCDGSAVSRTTYALLFAAIGTTYGIGDGVNTFNVPDIRGKAVLGAGTGVSGGVTGYTITAGGVGYTSATVTFSAPTGGGVTATGTAVVTAGAVVKIVITNRGSGYTAAPTITIGGPGAGATATATIALTTRALAATFGEETHTQSAAEVGRHTHKTALLAAFGGGGNGAMSGTTNELDSTGTNTDGGDPFNVVQPGIALNYIIKAA